MFGVKRQFVFICDSCKELLILDFDEDEIDQVDNDNVEVECNCGKQCRILRN